MRYRAPMVGRYLTCAQVAECLTLSEQTVRVLIRKGVIPAVKVGRNVRVSEAELDRYLAAHQVPR